METKIEELIEIIKAGDFLENGDLKRLLLAKANQAKNELFTTKEKLKQMEEKLPKNTPAEI